jgi:hypothetical protein
MTAAERIEGLLTKAISLHQQGDLARARAMYTEILENQPNHVDALHLLGVIAHQTKQYHHAVAWFDKSITAKPDFAEAYSNRGLALQALGRLDAAIASYDRAIALRHDYAEAWYNRGNALRNKQLLEAAMTSYDKAIAIKPGFAEAYANRGILLFELNQFDEALASYDRAIAIKPDYTSVYTNRGAALQELKRYDEALASYDKSIAIKPDYAEAHYNRGKLLQELKQPDAAISSYDKAVAIRPDYAEAHYNKSLALLLKGNFRDGLPLYEWRWKTRQIAPFQRQFRQKAWLGDLPIDGKTILLHGETGLGDTIQFCRYARTVTSMGAKVILEVQPTLLRLLQGLEGVSAVVSRGSRLPAFDLHCPLMSLPLACHTDLKTIPTVTRYITTPNDKVADWQHRLGKKTGELRIGVVWSGSSWPKHSSERSIPLSELVTRLPENIEYVSLQQEIRADDKATLESTQQIRHYGEELKDFSDTAALCELMDLIISIDTGVAHLSAALGRQTWIMLPFLPDWRWLLDRNESPWYPTATLFRQSSPDSWGSTIDEVVRLLRSPAQTVQSAPSDR